MFLVFFIVEIPCRLTGLKNIKQDIGGGFKKRRKIIETQFVWKKFVNYWK
ncbi:hypothetical protein [uncultured Apibacter sp.]|nr:hypothetical protein [uncultured Apibacter sp.]